MGALPHPAPEDGVPRVFGRYVLLHNLGRGGMGEVFLAKTVAAGGFEKVCAVKKIRPDLGADNEFAARFRDEARVVVRLNHGNIAQVYDAGQIGDEYYLAMEYVEGQSLLKVILRAREVGRLIPPDIALYVVHELCSGLGYAHRRSDYEGGHLGLVHRDVNPQNVLVSYDGETKLIDFGLAASTLKSVATRAGVAMGKAHYMAPEQARGRDVDARTDVYAAGIVLWELLTAQRCLDIPKDGGPADVGRAIAMPKIDPPSARVPGLSPELDAVVMKALSPRAEDRYENAETFRRAIAEKLYRLNPSIGPDVLAEYLHELFHAEILAERKQVAELLAQELGALVREAETEARRTVTFVRPGAEVVGPAAAPPPGPAALDPADATVDLAAGTVLAGRYEIIEQIGSGGMGTVYSARHLDIDRRVAVKILHPGLAQNAEVIARFRREARAASMIGHPNIVLVTDFGQTRGGRAFFVMEYLEGDPLSVALKREAPLVGRRAARILRQVASALHAAHEAGIIHRDLKPDNVFLLRGERGAEVAKILDFGIAKVTGREESLSPLTQSGLVFGTPQYMSPEQAAGQTLDRRADIYSAGILLYECLTGSLPFTGATVGQVLARQLSEAPMPPRRRAPQAEIPEPMELITLKMLAKDPAERYQTAAEVDEDLRRFLAGNPVLAGEDKARKRGATMPPPPPTPSAAVATATSTPTAAPPPPAAPTGTPRTLTGMAPARATAAATSAAAGTTAGAAAPAGAAPRTPPAPAPPSPSGRTASPSATVAVGGAPAPAALFPTGASGSIDVGFGSGVRPMPAASESVAVSPQQAALSAMALAGVAPGQFSTGYMRAVNRRSRIFLLVAVLGAMIGVAAIAVAVVIYLNPPPAPLAVSAPDRRAKASAARDDTKGAVADAREDDTGDEAEPASARPADRTSKTSAPETAAATAAGAAATAGALAPAAESRVVLTFRSKPTGARVRAGDHDVGITPVALPVPRGTFALSFDVSLDGYETATVSVVPRRDRPVDVKLKKRPRSFKAKPRLDGAASSGAEASGGGGGGGGGPATGTPATSAPATAAPAAKPKTATPEGLKDPYR
ncbi:MAG TPA: serine/threonine-protein kinase [Myxococcota bacterium]|jgi:serine/threonine-protein kinase|nr:serine/threonine-protein kinase [Myxococcota bacterium]